jgi:hypothetical protein
MRLTSALAFGSCVALASSLALAQQAPSEAVPGMAPAQSPAEGQPQAGMMGGCPMMQRNAQLAGNMQRMQQQMAEMQTMMREMHQQMRQQR